VQLGVERERYIRDEYVEETNCDFFTTPNFLYYFHGYPISTYAHLDDHIILSLSLYTTSFPLIDERVVVSDKSIEIVCDFNIDKKERHMDARSSEGGSVLYSYNPLPTPKMPPKHRTPLNIA
jgi:hypothetical protein